MKKFLALIILIAISFSAIAQVYLPPQDFSGAVYPPEGWTIYNGGDDNTFVNGFMPLTTEPSCAWIETSSNMTNDDRIISPEISLPADSEAKLYAQLRGSVGYALAMYWDPDNEVRYFMEVSTDGGNTWTAVLDLDDQASVQAAGVSWPWPDWSWFDVGIDMSDYAGQTIMVAFHHEKEFIPTGGGSFGVTNMGIWEDIQNDAQLLSMDMADYAIVDNNVEIGGVMKNIGSNNITSFEGEYLINGELSETFTIEGIDLAAFETYNFVAGNPAVFNTVDIFQVELNITKVNGVDDNSPENNFLIQQISIASESVDRKPLFEMFTSSTCGACPWSNETVDGVLQSNPSSTYSLVKYQVDWPGSGDPYYIEDCGIRADYYGVGGVPDFYSNGYYTSGSSFTQAKFNQAAAEDAYVEVDLEYIFDGLNVEANLTVDPKINIADASAYFAVVEKTTYDNIGTNGETEFHNVLMAMMPDGNGISTSLDNGVTISFNGSANLITTFIEEFDDLMVVAWVQDNETHSVLQSESYGLIMGGNENQTIVIEPGFQFVSSRINPEDPDMMVVVNEILNDDFVYIRNSEGSMLRKIGPNWVNGIGDWIGTEGYLVKTNGAGQFTVEGSLIPVDTPIDVVAGFQFISYLPDSEMDALNAFSSIIGDNLLYVRSTDGSMLRKIGPNWVNGIGNCVPGEGYLVKMTADAILIYPEEGKSASINRVKPNYFQFEGGNAADPVYTIYVDGLEIGDEVAVFDLNKMVGACVVVSENVLENSVPVFSTLTRGKGFETENPISLVVWDSKDQTEVSASYTFIDEYAKAYTRTNFPENDGEFSVINVTKGNRGIMANEPLEVDIYPNPASDVLNIVSNNTINRFKVLNFVGQTMLDKEVNETTLSISTSLYNPGIYIIKIETNNGIKTEKVTIK